MRSLLNIFVSALVCLFARQIEPAAISINWDPASRVKIADGSYCRVRQLANGQLAAVYARGANGFIKFSNDNGKTWINERLVFEGTSAYNMANAELIQLKNNTLIYGMNRRVKPDFWKKDFTYAIQIKTSPDNGKTWTDSQTLYTAGNENGIGCWEPSFLQLPGGEVQCYFANEFPYPDTNEQEISLLRSFDNGLSWTKNAERVCFAKKGRDGMPVPVLDQRSGQILVAIEENHGGKHLLQPVIICTSLADNWKGGFVGDDDPRRIHVAPDLSADRYAGAPYMAQLKTGQLILSFQDRDGREKKKELIKVRTAGGYAMPFVNESVPFPVGTGEATEWNSLTITSDGSILAVTSTSAYDHGIYMIKGAVKN